jgi:hypothetical protein
MTLAGTKISRLEAAHGNGRTQRLIVAGEMRAAGSVELASDIERSIRFLSIEIRHLGELIDIHRDARGKRP